MNAEIFKNIFLPYHKKLYGIAYKFLDNQMDAEDMVQETYVKLWQKREELESLINPESFAVTLLKNACLDFLKKVKPEFLAVYETNPESVDTIIIQLENQDKLNHIQLIIKQLPVQQRRIIQMKVWDNLADEEIETLTGLSKGNIKVIISRARRTIKKLYKKWEKNENERFIR
jgi:RNA polymerase sigma-70 factor (ECF subfamily)